MTGFPVAIEYMIRLNVGSVNARIMTSRIFLTWLATESAIII